jgi:hypothetical protein
VGTFFVYTLGTGLLRGGNAGFFEYFIHWGSAVCAPYLMYMNSMRLDKKYELEPIRFRWLDPLTGPIKDWLIPKVPGDLRDTGPLHARSAGDEIIIEVSGSTAKFGEVEIPVAKITNVEYEREHRGLLIGGGIFLPMVLIAILGKMTNESFIGFFPQLFGLASLAVGAVLIFWGVVQSTPAGKLAGPYRILWVHYTKEDDDSGVFHIKFNRPEDERAFLQTLENGLKTMPRAEISTAPATDTAKLEPGRLRRLIPFKF